MTLLNAPAYNERREKLTRNQLIGGGILFAVLVVLTLAGFITGHGWLYSNRFAEHKVDRFLTAIQNKDFKTAYGLYENDPDWEQHPDRYSSYPLKRFTEDWTEYTGVGGPIQAHRVDKSVTDGSGTFGTGIIVAVTVNGDKRIFLYYVRKDGTLSYPAPHIFEY